jgi:hypothetical protein
MKTKLLAMILLSGGALWADTNFYFGIGIGNPRPQRYAVQPPPPPPPVRYAQRSPGRNYAWVPGYWVWMGNGYAWQDGYWMKQGRGNGRQGGKHDRDRDWDRDR